MAISLCTITGNVNDLLGNSVQGCVLNVTAPTPFFHDSGAWISGQLGSVTTASNGSFSIPVIETASCNQVLNFTFNYSDGISSRRNKTYSVVVPNTGAATLFSLIGTTAGSPITPLGVQYGGTGVGALPQYNVLLGNGANGVAAAAPGTAGYPLVSNGAAAAPSFQQVSLSTGVTGNLAPSGMPALTGDVTTTAGTVATSLVATSNATLTALSALTTASSLTSVGTIGTGTWQGTRVAAGYGGTAIDTSASTGVPTISSGTWSVSTRLPSTNFPALTGDVTTVAGALGTTLAATTNATLTSLSALTTASSLVTIGTITSGTWAGTTIATNHGGTGVTSVTTAPAASAFAGWDANSNLSANNHIAGFATTATAAGTTTLTVSSAELQYFTGTTTQTVKLPVVATGPLPLGFSFTIVNLSSGVVTVQSSGANTIQAMAANTQLVVNSVATSGTGTAAWNWTYQAIQNALAGGGTISTLTGDVTASGSGSVVATLAATSNATLASLDKSTGVAIHGSNTNDSGSAGYVGEWKSAGTAGTASTFPAISGHWGDMGSLSLTAGDWDVTLTMTQFNNSSTCTVIDIGISTTTGDFSTGLVLGDNWVEGPWQATNTADMSICIPCYRMSLSSTTTVYAKVNVTTSAGTPKFFYRMSARRMR